MILNLKYVLHIPTHKFENKIVTAINMKKCMEDLEKKLNENGYHSFYKSKVEGHYKSRTFEEVLITIFTNNTAEPQPDKLFIEWFKEHNDELKQESFAYEKNNELIIEKL